MSTKRIWHDQQHWQRLIEKHARSGLSGAKFCRQQHIAYASFMAWRKRLQAGLHTWGMVHERTLSLSPYQNGKQENLWATLEGRLMAMIGSTNDCTLERLNLLTQVWLEQDYHRNRHSEIATKPLQRFTDATSVELVRHFVERSANANVGTPD